MVNITNRDWTDFVAEVRSRLDVIDANIQNMKVLNEQQHEQLKEEFTDLKEQLVGDSERSLANRVRSLEDSRTKMNGVQLGLSMAFSLFTGLASWLFGHGIHLSMQEFVSKAYFAIIGYFRR